MVESQPGEWVIIRLLGLEYAVFAPHPALGGWGEQSPVFADGLAGRFWAGQGPPLVSGLVCDVWAVGLNQEVADQVPGRRWITETCSVEGDDRVGADKHRLVSKVESGVAEQLPCCCGVVVIHSEAIECQCILDKVSIPGCGHDARSRVKGRCHRLEPESSSGTLAAFLG